MTLILDIIKFLRKTIYTMNILKTLLIPTCTLIAISLSGCGPSLNPNSMELNIHNEDSPGGWGARTYTILTIRSLESDPITLNKVDVNNGRCSYTGRYRDPINLPAHFQIGQSLQLYLACSSDSVVKVDIETDKGNASYNFK